MHTLPLAAHLSSTARGSCLNPDVGRHMKTLVSALVFAFVVTGACADSWMAANVATYTSSRGDYRLTIFPQKPTRAPSNEQSGCEATLEKLVGEKYEVLWRKPLVNEVSPVSALVSDSDGSFVTFDNWYSMGEGKDVIVIYTGEGEMLKKFALTDIMSQNEHDHLPRTASSIMWSGKHELDYDHKVLNVRIVLSGRDGNTTNNYRTIRIRLDTAEIFEEQSSQQAGPAYPPQGVGSADP